jgi:hypothetical protein
VHQLRNGSLRDAYSRQLLELSLAYSQR